MSSFIKNSLFLLIVLLEIFVDVLDVDVEIFVSRDFFLLSLALGNSSSRFFVVFLAFIWRISKHEIFDENINISL
jgi:hypothetical protein